MGSYLIRDRAGSLLLVLLFAGLLIAAHPFSVSPEDFEGETIMLKRLEPDELLTYFGLHYQMNRYQRKQYLSLESRKLRDKWMDTYWKLIDPTPATEVNERKVEHEKRVGLARKLFGMKKAPGWDKRGETLIRFGMPANRTLVSPNVGFYEVVPPGEIWHYESLDMMVAFQDFNLSGEYILPFDFSLVGGSQLQDQLKNIVEYTKNAELVGAQLTPQEVNNLASFNPDDIGYTADPDIRLSQAKNLIAEFESIKTQKSVNNYYKYMKERPTVYSYEINSSILPFYFDINKFNAGAGKLRVDIDFEVPLSEIRFVSRGGIIRGDVRLAVLVRDIDMNEVASANDHISMTYRGDAELEGPSHLPGQVTLILDPGYYRVGIEAVDMNSGNSGAFTTNVEMEELHGSLKLSDIQFASGIKQVTEISKFVKGNLQIVPHPLHAYRIPFPLIFYFEIYGLDTDPEGLAFYSVEYEIIPMRKKRWGPVYMDVAGAVSSKFETSGFGTKQHQNITISTESLWEGSFKLNVKVVDRRTSRTASRSTYFSVLD